MESCLGLLESFRLGAARWARPPLRVVFIRCTRVTCHAHACVSPAAVPRTPCRRFSRRRCPPLRAEPRAAPRRAGCASARAASARASETSCRPAAAGAAPPPFIRNRPLTPRGGCLLPRPTQCGPVRTAPCAWRSSARHGRRRMRTHSNSNSIIPPKAART